MQLLRRMPPRARVLVIDDEPLMLTALRRLLRDYDVTTTDDGKEALVLLTSGNAFEAILCDVNLPGMSGPELRDVLCELGSPMAGRFIWMSGASCPVDGPFVAKPFEREELERVVDLVADPSSPMGAAAMVVNFG